MQNSFVEAIRSLPAPFLVAIVAIVMVFGSGIVIAIAKQFRGYFCHRQELAFKRELVERGLSVEEIERVIAARTFYRASGD